MRIKFLKCFLLSIFFLCFQEAFALWPFDSDPEWLIKIESQFQGNTIIGTGYVVQIGSSLYVRTASHVTLGGNARIQLYSNSKILKQNGYWISNNIYDDQLIGIDAPQINPLAIYMPKTKVFVVNPRLQINFKEDLRVQKIQRSADSDFFLVPTWSRRSIEDFHSKRNSMGGLSDLSPTGLRLTKGSSFFYSDMSILPGESGSPVVGYIRSYNLDKNGETYTGSMKDETRVATTHGEFGRYGMVPVILGHVLSYMYDFPISTFLSPYRSADLPNAIQGGQSGRDLLNVQWNFSQGIFYRESKNGDDTIVEANFFQHQAGDGTAGNGGDGTAGNGGDGTAGNGGDGTAGNGGDGTAGNGGDGISIYQQDNLRISSGMKINSEHVAAFEAYYKNSNKPVFIYANWDNYFALKTSEQIQSFSRISVEQSLTNLIRQKIKKLPENTSRSWGTCTINSLDLREGILTLYIAGFGKFTFPLKTTEDRRKFFPIIRGERSGEQSRPHGRFAIDLRGLYSIDLTQLSPEANSMDYVSEVDYFSDRPYIIISYPNQKYGYVRCYAHNEN